MSMEMQMQQTQETPSAPQKISEWLTETIGSHEIAVFGPAAVDFKEKTGREFIDIEYADTAFQIRREIKARGLGGYYNGDEPGITGFVLAEALARKYADYGGAFTQGRGSRYRAAVQALRKAGL